MVNDKDFYRMIRYLTILTSEQQSTNLLLAEKFNLGVVKLLTTQEIMKNICKDFGLPYETVLKHSELEKWS